MFGFTSNGFESFWRYTVKRTKRIKLAVIGTPSSGKSYLLNDIVLTFNMMGLQQRSLPLSFPYSNFSHYFFDISDNDGNVLGTKNYACRQENHYGAMLEGFRNDQKIDIEFVNIPGEVFTDNQQGMAMFFDLKKALRRASSVFTVTTWQSIGGEQIYVVEPTDRVRSTLGLEPVDKTYVDPAFVELPQMRFGNWKDIFSFLNKHQYTEMPKTRKTVNGKYLLDHFYEVMADSMMQTIKDAWSSFATHVSVTRDQFINNNMDRDFYFCKYCQEATDIVICDKLFAPGGVVSEAEMKSAQNFTGMTQLLNGFLNDSRNAAGILDHLFSVNKGTPNIYLAFRGADMMVNEEKVMKLYDQLIPYKGVRDNIIYSCFMHNLYEYMQSGYQHPEIGKWIGVKTNEEYDALAADYVNVHGLTTLTNQNLKDHIMSRLGNTGMGFWQLLSTVGNSRRVAAAKAGNLPIAPHVYFTATPIDSSYRIYENDKSQNNMRFIRQDNKGRVIAFHAVGQPLCFGTYQLAMDILVQNGISPATFKPSEMIRRLQVKLK